MPEEIKLEVGKFYRTDAGEKVHILANSPHGHNFPYVGIIIDTGIAECWDSEGQCYGDDRTEDIIAEWKEPATVESTVTVRNNSQRLPGCTGTVDSYHFLTLEMETPSKVNPRYGESEIIAIRKIRYTEGGKIEDITEEEV